MFYVWLVLIVTILFGIIGFFDDYLKIKERIVRGSHQALSFPCRLE